MLSCPCRKRGQKDEVPRLMSRQALTAQRLRRSRPFGGSQYYQPIQTKADLAYLQSLLPANMSTYELAGTALYPSATNSSASQSKGQSGSGAASQSDILDIRPPTQVPAPNPPLTDTGLKWMWPSEVFGKKAALYIMGKCDKQAANWGDVNEGSLGDCWLMAGIAAIARYGVAANLFSNVVGDNPQQVTITLCKQDGPYGSFQTQFPITVTTQIPVDNHKHLIYVKSDSYGEYWPCLLEKAVASVLYTNGVNGYSSIVGGYTNCGLGLFLPGQPLEVYLNQDNTGAITTTVTDLQNAWTKLMKSGCTVDVSFVAISNTVLPDGQLPGNKGLLAQHAYTVYALVTAPLGTAPPTSTTPTVTLALLRNPYGEGSSCSTPNGGEWSGQWSDCDMTTWAANPFVAQACAWDGQKNDGMFWMSLQDILLEMLPYYGLFIPADPTLRATDLTQNPLGGTAVAIAPSTTCKNVQFGVTPKKRPYELEWAVPGTNTYAAVGTYAGNGNSKTPVVTTACLEPGTYNFVAGSSYGDGWSNGTFAISVNGKQTVPATAGPTGPGSLMKSFTVA